MYLLDRCLNVLIYSIAALRLPNPFLADNKYFK